MRNGPAVRGSPFLQAILVVVAFLLAGVPVWRLTRPASAAADPDTTPSFAYANAAAKPVPLDVEAVCAPAPVDFQIRNLDQTVLEGHGPQPRFTAHWTALVPVEGLDLVVQAHWAAAPAAARVVVRFPDGRSAEKSFWAGADGAVTEDFTMPGVAATPSP